MNDVADRARSRCRGSREIAVLRTRDRRTKKGKAYVRMEDPGEDPGEDLGEDRREIDAKIEVDELKVADLGEEVE